MSLIKNLINGTNFDPDSLNALQKVTLRAVVMSFLFFGTLVWPNLEGLLDLLAGLKWVVREDWQIPFLTQEELVFPTNLLGNNFNFLPNSIGPGFHPQIWLGNNFGVSNHLFQVWGYFWAGHLIGFLKVSPFIS